MKRENLGTRGGIQPVRTGSGELRLLAGHALKLFTWSHHSSLHTGSSWLNLPSHMVPGPVPQLSSSDFPAHSLPPPPPPSHKLAKGPPHHSQACLVHFIAGVAPSQAGAHLAGPGGWMSQAAHVCTLLRRRTWAMETGAAAPLVFFLLPGDMPLPAWPGQWVGGPLALGEHLYCAGAERSGGGDHVQQPRTTATHILILPEGKEDRHGSSMLQPPLPASSLEVTSFPSFLCWIRTPFFWESMGLQTTEGFPLVSDIELATPTQSHDHQAWPSSHMTKPRPPQLYDHQATPSK
ncbi:hypothetical protein L345_09013, partial [Ophiophagus hannah]